MVEDRITDGKRIAQLLASELIGLTAAPMDRFGVDDANPDAEPSAQGTFAYAIDHDGNRIGEVFVHDESARIDVFVDDDAAVDGTATEPTDSDSTAADGLTVATTDGVIRMHVEYGAAVKRAIDRLAAIVDDG